MVRDPNSGVSIVIPTVGRGSLAELLGAVARGMPAPVPIELLLVDDRPPGGRALPVPLRLLPYTRVLAGRAAGPAAARNTGWHSAQHRWVVFLDDDVVPERQWLTRLVDDLSVPGHVGGVQGRVRVPLPNHRPPTDWERNTAGLADSRWITADMAYRWAALAAVGGFDERFPRPYREDAELAHRVMAAGWQLRVGRRCVTHPVRPERPFVSVRTQRGNADDALLRRIYGPGWRVLLEIPPGARRDHVRATAAAVAAVAAGLVAATARPPARTSAKVVALMAAAGWLAATGKFALRRIRPGPREPRELSEMLLTSVAIPPLACLHWLRGWWGGRGARQWPR